MKRKLTIKNLIIVVLSLIFLFGFIRQERTMNRMNEDKANQESKLEDVKEENQRLNEKKNEAESGEYLEQLAREKLNMHKEGEYSVVDKTDTVDTQKWGYYKTNNIYF